jgi:hypothetical protein
MRNHTALGSFVVQRKHRIGRAARLEGANLLEILTFEKNLDARRAIDETATDNRGAMNVRLDARVRVVDGLQRDGHVCWDRLC